MNHIGMMRLAERVALQSVCKRAQVGAVLTDGVSTYTGYNARPCGGQCEGEDGRTLPDVVHAEIMALEKCLGSIDNPAGMTLYVTRQPCLDCADQIARHGIHAVYYRDADDKTDGLGVLLYEHVAIDERWIQGQVQDSWADRNGVMG